MANMTAFQIKMQQQLPDLELRFDEPLSKHTSFRIGGPAEVMAFPKTGEELEKILKLSALLDSKPAILGAGTNVLAPDEGLPGLTVCLKDCLDGIGQVDDTHIRVAAGVTMTRAAVFAANLGLSGLEFAHGIPGTVGGGVYMNAGAYGGEISQVCTQVEALTPEGERIRHSGADMRFSYRHSVVEETGGVVLSAVFALTPKPREEIRERMQELLARRKASQPLEYPSAGSFFKRPVGAYAGALIEQAGLKGFQVGGAAVSSKHAGFVINAGGATAADVKTLMARVSQKVLVESGFLLEPEVRIW